MITGCRTNREEKGRGGAERKSKEFQEDLRRAMTQRQSSKAEENEKTLVWEKWKRGITQSTQKEVTTRREGHKL